MDIFMCISILFMFGLIVVVILIVLMFLELFSKKPDLFYY